MPGKRLKTYHLQLEFRAALMRATICDAEGKLSKYWCDNADVCLARSMIRTTDRLADLHMFVEQLERITEERTCDFNFSDKYGADIEYAASPFDHFLETMLQLVAERIAAMRRAATTAATRSSN